ncbi:MAG: bifunctional adenosylcobinamide kinase/adenosylcobinamide-phosphate guanylyltransferase, partial [Pseudomonadota bacterium]
MTAENHVSDQQAAHDRPRHWPHSAASALVFGGARSGKTARALALAEGFAERIYIATAEAWDAEMRARIERHKQERADDPHGAWQSIEAPHDLADQLMHLASQLPRAGSSPMPLGLGDDDDAPAGSQTPRTVPRPLLGTV